MENDTTPLTMQKHKYNKVKTGWGFSTSWRWLDKKLDYLYLIFNKPKMTESNLEKAKDYFD